MHNQRDHTEGFIDGATITSALTYLNLGRKASHPIWHIQSIHEATYLMLHDSIHIIPRPKGLGGERGDYAIVAEEFPELIVDFENRKSVVKSTFGQAENAIDVITSAWESSCCDDDFQSWAQVQRQDRWPNQSVTYGALFDPQSIPTISRVSGYDMEVVKKIHDKSADPKVVARWAGGLDSDEEAQIANAGWIIGGFVRGLFYENLAASEGLQLLSHPFRLVAAPTLDFQDQHEFTNAEEALVKILVANALREPTKQQRVRTWSKTVRHARDYIKAHNPDLEPATQRAAEDKAINVAKKIDLHGGPQYTRTIIDYGLESAVTIAGFKVGPWAPGVLNIASRTARATYKVLRKKTPGEDLGDLYYKSSLRFRWLARSVPGRIERTLRDRE